MLSDNIRYHRKRINLSQDELAAKVGVSRQSVSFWETGQTQPTIDNIIALSKIFNISSDLLLKNSDSSNPLSEKVPEDKPPKKKSSIWLIIVLCVALAAVISVVLLVTVSGGRRSPGGESGMVESGSADQVETEPPVTEPPATEPPATEPPATEPPATEPPATEPPATEPPATEPPATEPPVTAPPVTVFPETVPPAKPFDLFEFCKQFAIANGSLNGDYCMYQQPATRYGGYDNEYFSIAYWADSDMVEFCLHCPLSDILSHNFYLRMRGGFNGTYEYVSSKYFRDTGESLRFAAGYIDPTAFSDNYPISCDEYIGSVDGQTDFMEQSRVGICDLIRCIQAFVIVEDLDCDFSEFCFLNF